MTLQEKYRKEIIPELSKSLGIKNALSCPKVLKVVVNVGIGKRVLKDTSKKEDIIKNISEDLMIITGQRPQVREAKKSISGFGVRKGMPVGLRVVLRRKKMYGFLEKLINIVFPRVRDFQGINPSCIDNEGNITVGISEQLVFPEISPDKVNQFFGMEITVVTTAKNKKEGEELLRQLGFPLIK